MPALDPAGAPRSSSTTSPGVSIEPGGFLVGQRGGEIAADPVLAEHADRLRNCLGDRELAMPCHLTEFIAGGSADPDRRCLGHAPSLTDL